MNVSVARTGSSSSLSLALLLIVRPVLVCVGSRNNGAFRVFRSVRLKIFAGAPIVLRSDVLRQESVRYMLESVLQTLTRVIVHT